MRTLSFIKTILLLLVISFLSAKIIFAKDYNKQIEKYFLGKKLETLEGIWKKTYANQGPTGCITIFFKADKDLFNQIHIDSCFVMNKVTGRQSKKTDRSYVGENAVYYYNGDVSWGTSKIEISDDLSSFVITHISNSNTFTEKWTRIWPEDIKSYNKLLENN